MAGCGIHRQHHVIKRITHTVHTSPTHLGVTLHAVGQAVLSQQALHGAQRQHAAADAALAHKQHSRLEIGNRGTQGRGQERGERSKLRIHKVNHPHVCRSEEEQTPLSLMTSTWERQGRVQ